MGRNIDAETAFSMAMKLVEASGQSVSEQVRQSVWDKCHADTTLQTLVSRWVYSSFDYAPKALYKVHTRLMEVVQSA